MSRPSGLVLCVALSTAFSPFTPVAPPEDRLMRSQPGPSGWQLTEGGAGSGPFFGSAGDLSVSGTSGSATGWSPPDPPPPGGRVTVDGVDTGPVSRAHPAE